jgi:hypothetical protein
MREPGQQRYGIIFDVWVHFLDLVTSFRCGALF